MVKEAPIFCLFSFFEVQSNESQCSNDGIDRL